MKEMTNKKLEELISKGEVTRAWDFGDDEWYLEFGSDENAIFVKIIKE